MATRKKAAPAATATAARSTGKRSAKAATPRKAASPKKPAAKQADPFAAAKPAARRKGDKAAAKAATILRIPDVAGDDAHKAVRAFRAAKLQQSAAEAQAKEANERLKPIVLDLFVDAWLAAGERPATPIQVTNNKGDKVPYVVQDKSSGAALKDALYEQVAEVLPGIEQLVDEEEVYQLNAELLAEDGVREKISQALAAVLTPEQLERLLVRSVVYRCRESLVPHLVDLAGGDKAKLTEALNLLSGVVVRYLSK